jgi:hypothetical protein
MKERSKNINTTRMTMLSEAAISPYDPEASTAIANMLPIDTAEAKTI